VGQDQTLYVTSQFSTSIFHYSRVGSLLGSIPIGVTGAPVFMSVFLVPEPCSCLHVLMMVAATVLVTGGRSRRLSM
jgi:hypothetical protein